jgi:hypothetical protein
MDIPAEFSSPVFQNRTCDLFTPREQSCELGNYASYVINVTCAQDVIAGINFAKQYNVRLVIKNTGHDYLGRSTGKGGLTLWTHNLKETNFIPTYKSSSYTGPAFKVGAGVQGFEVLNAANKTGTRMVGGTCPTVGIAGGYTQGGGHSILSTSHGMAADNALEWEVVTMDGRHLVATPSKNSDLYWALSGSGPGNYAVVLSLTARAYKDSIVGGASLAFNDTKVGADQFWDAIGAFHRLLPPFVDNTGYSFLYLLTQHVFQIAATTMPGADLAKVNAMLKPFLEDLTKRGIDYQYTPTVSQSYFYHYSSLLGPLPEGVIGYAPFVDSRMIPRNLVLNSTTNRVITNTLRNTTLGPNANPMPCMTLSLKNLPHPDNSVHPSWRDALLFCAPDRNWDNTSPLAVMEQRADYSVDVQQPMLDAATPGGGSYGNEVSWKLENWQDDVYGSNYPKLLQIKQKYDPQSLLYVTHGVGSDVWREDESQRLCRT